jgi:hypothetical protein
MRNANYMLNPKVRKDSMVVSLAHFEALILWKSSIIIQDDSGIPFSVLSKHAVEILLFGDYRGLGMPNLCGLDRMKGSIVRSLYQSDLAAVPSVGPLPFKFGYRNVIRPSTTASPEASEPFKLSSNFKGSHLLVAKLKPRSE